jgi:hypothetical protein
LVCWYATATGSGVVSGNDEPCGKRFLRKRLPTPSVKRDTDLLAGPYFDRAFNDERVQHVEFHSSLRGPDGHRDHRFLHSPDQRRDQRGQPDRFSRGLGRGRLDQDALPCRSERATRFHTAIQQALDDTPASNKILYLPPGTYRVSDTLRWGHGGGGSEQKRQILQGAGMDLTTIRLPDASLGYTDPSSPRSLIWTGQRPAQRFRNAIRDLTVDTGRGNPGAIGVQFIANNQGQMQNVRIRSGDGQGQIGLDMRFTNEIGPLLVRNLHVIGFDRGVWTNWDTASVTFEHVTLENQNVFGWHNRAQKVFLRGLKSNNRVPVIYNEKDSAGQMVVTEADLFGTGEASQRPAILNERSMYVRDIRTSGYQMAIRHNDKGRGNEPGVQGPDVPEWQSHHVVMTLFDTPARSLRLPIKEVPRIPWGVLTEWASPLAFGGQSGRDIDATSAIQQAIDSGATTVYLPNGAWRNRRRSRPARQRTAVDRHRSHAQRQRHHPVGRRNRHGRGDRAVAGQLRQQHHRHPRQPADAGHLRRDGPRASQHAPRSRRAGLLRRLGRAAAGVQQRPAHLRPSTEPGA